MNSEKEVKMYRLILILFAIFTLITTVYAQPPIGWINAYMSNNINGFSDIYPPAAGGYVMCGKTQANNVAGDNSAEMWAVRIDNDGNEIWNRTFGLNDEWDTGWSIIEVDEGGFLAGGSSGDYPGDNQIAAWRITEDGEQLWFRTYGLGTCYAIIELKSGEYLLTGKRNRTGFLICINGEGEPLWARDFEHEGRSGKFVAMRETLGGVVLAGSISQPYVGWSVKASIENEGNVIWDRTYDNFIAQSYNSIVSGHNGGFVLGGTMNIPAGPWIERQSDYLAVKISNEGDPLWNRCYNFGDGEATEVCRSIERLPVDGYVLVGHVAGFNGAGVTRITSNGVVRWQGEYSDITDADGNRIGQIQDLTSVIVGQDQSLISSGWGLYIGEAANYGMVLKLEPEILAPLVFEWSPEDTILTVLPGDSIQFTVNAIDQQDDEMNYLWFMGEDTLSINNTTRFVHFEELGDYDVVCQVSDGEFTTEITWHITVRDWYIDMFQPESTEITIRRGSWIDFTHQVRAIEDLEFEYQWDHFGRGGNFEFEGEDSIRYNFDLSGDHIIRAWITNDEERQTIEWDVNVHSIIWWWWPHELVMSAPVDTTMVFEVFPFNEESDSLDYSWFLNDEILESDSSFIEILFSETGQYVITAYAEEGIEIDTIRWAVNVLERSFTADEMGFADVPTSVTLYPPTPNPCNSQAQIEFYVPETNDVRIAIFDQNGRLVTGLDKGKLPAGCHKIMLETKGLSTGLYLLQLTAGTDRQLQKIIVIK